MGDARVFRMQVVYAVVGLDPEDGLRNMYSYWTNRKKAESVADEWNARRGIRSSTNEYTVVAQQIWREMVNTATGEHAYYKIPTLEELAVDAPSVESIKAKLTNAELKVLGIKR